MNNYPCLSHCSIASRDTMAKATLTKEAFNQRPACKIKGLVHDHHCGKQTGVMLGQYLKMLHPDLKAACLPPPHDTPPATRPHLLSLPKQFH